MLSEMQKTTMLITLAVQREPTMAFTIHGGQTTVLRPLIPTVLQDSIPLHGVLEAIS